MLHKSKVFLSRNASTILTCIGAGGVILTTVLAVKATPKAIQHLKEAREEKGEELTKTETVIVAAPSYIPTTLAGVGTVACIFGANALNKRQQASLVSAYALLDSSYREYRNKVIEGYGKEEDENIKMEIAKDNYTEMSVEDGNILFYDEFSKRYFETSMFKVQQAQYYLNRDLSMRDYAYLNEYYDYLGIPQIEGGWELGWSTGACLDMYWQNWIDFGHKKMVMDDGLECHMIIMYQEPIMGFEDYS